MLTLQGKNIIVTGASSGLGQACAILFSHIGANVILVGRNEERLNYTYNALKPGEHHIIKQDLTQIDKVGQIVVEAFDNVGPISGFMHCAGVEKTIPLRSMKPEVYSELFTTNVVSGFEIAKFASNKKFADKSGASFVFLSSVMGSLGESGKVAYCSSKAALIGGVKSMALELVKKKIRVNTISPAMINTQMSEEMFSTLPEEVVDDIKKKHPLGIGEVEDVANLGAFLLSDLSKWITGANYIIDGGYSVQ